MNFNKRRARESAALSLVSVWTRHPVSRSRAINVFPTNHRRGRGSRCTARASRRRCRRLIGSRPMRRRASHGAAPRSGARPRLAPRGAPPMDGGDSHGVTAICQHGASKSSQRRCPQRNQTKTQTFRATIINFVYCRDRTDTPTVKHLCTHHTVGIALARERAKSLRSRPLGNGRPDPS